MRAKDFARSVFEAGVYLKLGARHETCPLGSVGNVFGITGNALLNAALQHNLPARPARVNP
jgi:hypothetical protein